MRNGDLRVRYDGVKYAVRKLEDVLYEINMANARSTTDEREDNKDEVIDGASALNLDVIKMIKARYDAQDKERENIIKKSRDIQKLSKNAVFSLHRGQLDTATKQLKDCAKAANEIQSTILAEPNLRH